MAPFSILKGPTARITNVHTLLIAGLMAAPAAMMVSRGMKWE